MATTNHRWRGWGAALLGALLAGLCVLVAVDSSRLVGRSFPGFLVWDNGYLVSFHDSHWTGPSAGLPLNGGRVITVDGEPFPGGRALLEYADRLPAYTSVDYGIRYAGESRHYSVQTMTMNRWDYATTFGVYLWNALVCFAIGVVALFLRPDHLQVRAFAGAIISLGLVLALAIDLNSTYRLAPLYFIAEAILPASVMSFGLVFPIDLIGNRRRKIVLGSIFSLALSIGVANAVLFQLAPQAARFLTSVSWVWIGLAGASLPIIFGYSLFRAGSERERVQGAVVFTGALVSFIFGAAGLLAFFLLGWTFSLTWVAAPLFLFPITVLYAILRLDLFEAERFIRTTLGYAVATAAVAIAYAGGVSLLEQVVAPGISSGAGTSFLFLIVLAVAFEPIRQAVQQGVDRIFYRTALDAGRELKESSLEIAAITHPAAIRQQLEARVREALDLEWTQMRSSPLPESETALQERVAYRDELFGWLAVGPKHSGAPFSHAERELVRGMAAQSALALRNLKSLQELRDAQDSLLRAERLAAIGEFSQAIAHGIRNPLASIRAAAQIAGTRVNDERVAAPLRDVIQQADRLDHRVRALLDYSRPFEPQQREIRLATLFDDVRQALASQAARQGVQVEIKALPSSGLRPFSDPDLLTEALLELGANALRATTRGGVLSFSAELSEEVLVLRVSDSGSGVPEVQRERIFEPFFTTGEGTGLGLAGVRKIAESLGGTLRLETSSPQGSTFRIDLPAQRESASATSPTEWS